VPQYWHRAAGFDDMLIAHTESKQRVRFAREHVAPNDIPGTDNNMNAKNKMFLFISLLNKTISKNAHACKEKKRLFFYLK